MIEKIKGTPEQQQHRRELVDALRSGKYQQATGMLKTQDNRFCCLGVACDISGLGYWENVKESMVDTNYVITGRDPLGATLGMGPLNEYFGLGATGDFHPPVLKDGTYAYNLYNLNDSLHWSFDQIADFIEEWWEVAPQADMAVAPTA
jgi:hypothetical protein